MAAGHDSAGSPNFPLLSVIVPAYRRSDTLRRLLEALSRQTLSANKFEVLIVVDGAYEPVEDVLRVARTPYALRSFVRPHRGETAQRNFGLSQARGTVVLYLDDDTIPSAELLERHCAHFENGDRIAVFGALHLDPESTEPLVGAAFDWTSGHLARCASGAKPIHTDLPDNNFSTRKRDLAAIGGWDEGLSDGYGGIDDWELGYRLQQAGVQFVFDPHATAFHCWVKPLHEELEHCRVHGRAQLYYYAKFPERLGDLAVTRYIRGNAAERLLLHWARWCPEALVRLVCVSAGIGVRAVAAVNKPAAITAMKVLRHFFICRGFWDRRAVLAQVVRQVQGR